MKKIVISFVLILSFLSSYAQKDFQGLAVYESKTSTSDFKKRFEGNKEMTPDMQKMIEERMKKMFEKTFILNFDKQASIYKEEEKLDSPGQGGGGMRVMSSFMGGGGTYYKNVKDRNYTVDKEFMGKESRQIGGYTCYKATTVIPASKTDFRNFRPKREEDKKKEINSDSTKTEIKEKKTNFMEDIELPKEITVTAWYTPEIPVNQGPEGYWGLPGLILEVNDGKTIILCSKVVLNPKDKVEIKASNNGKAISQKDYDETVTKKMEEFRQMNQGQGGGRSFEMRMNR